MRIGRPVIVMAAALAVAGAAAAAVWAFVLRGDADPVPVAEAVVRFRASGNEDDEVEGGPAPGVYVYRTSGSEEIDALVGSRHDYPAVTTITATAGGCGVELAWNALGGRSTTWEICREDSGWRLAGYRETHSFFGQTERTDYRCSAESAWLPPPGRAAARSCTTGETDEASRVGTGPAEQADVGATSMRVVPVHVELELAGRTEGSGTIDAWLLANGLPVRLVLVNDNRTGSAIGDVRYRERAELELESLEPRR
jgi:hypothetical protein